MSEPVVRLRGLRKSYGRRPALAGINLDIDARQISASSVPTAPERAPCCAAWPGSSRSRPTKRASSVGISEAT